MFSCFRFVSLLRVLTVVALAACLLSGNPLNAQDTGATKEAQRAAKKESKKLLRETKKKLTQAMATGNADSFMEQCNTLAQIGTDPAIETLLGVNAAEFPNRKTYNQYIQILQKLDSPEQLKTMVNIGMKLGKKQKWQATIMFLDILAPHATDEASPFFKAAATSPLSRVRVAAVRHLAKLPNPSHETIAMLIESLRVSEKAHDEGTPHLEAREALERMTGLSYTKYKEWKKWLKKNPKPEPDLSDESEEASSPPIEEHAEKYYDIPVTSRRIVFIIDTSGSMTAEITGYEGGKTSRLERAKHELASLLYKLKPDTAFNIISFNTDVSVWQKRGMVPATQASVNSALNYIKQLKPQATTSANAALTQAIQTNPEADAIYFLTDGVPSDATPEVILAHVEKLNRFQRAKIHCIALGGGVYGNFLMELARQNEGEYQEVK